MIKAAVLGATGYAGIELVRLLTSHPEVSIEILGSHSFAGQKISDIYKNFNHLGNSDATALNRDIANGSPINDTPYVHYVMENDGSEAPTEIQVRATLLETDTYEAETKIFTAVINRNGLDRGYNHNYVKRNYVYRLNVTFGDTSFDGDHEKDPNIPIPPRPTTGDLDVQVEVVNWGQVSQDVEI